MSVVRASGRRPKLQGSLMSVHSAGTRPRTRVIFALLAVAAGTFAMLQSLVTPALPTMQAELGTTQSAISWVLIAWLLSASVATPILGRVADIIGKDKALLIVLGAIALGSLVAALAPNLGVLVLGRVIQGLGGAVYPVSFGIIRDEFERDRVASAVGSMSSVIAVGGGLGTVLAGPIVDGLGWRWLFGIPLIVVAVVGLLSWMLVPPTAMKSSGRINWLAAILLAAWLVALLIPVSVGAQWGWTSLPTLVLLAVAIVLIALWAMYESRTSNPLIDMRMMRLRAVWRTNVIAVLFGAAMFAIVTFLPQYLQTPGSAGYGFGSTVTEAGLLILPLLTTMAVGGLVSGPLGRVFGFKLQLFVGSLLLAAGALGFALWTAEAWQMATSGAVFGMGLGLAYAAMTSVIVHSVPPTQTGVATGINTNVRNIGGAVGTAVFTAIITSTTQASGYPTSLGYEVAFLVLAACALIAAVIALGLPKTRSASDDTSETKLETDAESVDDITAPVNIWNAADDDWR